MLFVLLLLLKSKKITKNPREKKNLSSKNQIMKKQKRKKSCANVNFVFPKIEHEPLIDRSDACDTHLIAMRHSWS